MERRRQHVLARAKARHIERDFLALARLDARRCLRRLPDLFAIAQEFQAQLILCRIAEQALVPDLDAALLDRQSKVLIVELHILQLRRALAVREDDAVAAEVAVIRAVAEVAAIGISVFAIAVAAIDGLVDEVPDEAALIARLAIRELRVLVHAAAAVAHRMRVLATDERLFGMLGKEFLDASDRRVHLAFHVARATKVPIPENALVMHEAARIVLAEELAHLKDVLAAARLVAARPDQDGRMVLVALEHRVRAIEQHRLPLGMIVGHDIFRRHMDAVLLPAAMRLHVRLIDDIEAINVGEVVDAALVRIM